MNAQHEAALKAPTQRESRKKPRVQLPLETKINDKSYRILDCSADGMGVDGSFLNLVIGETVNIQVFAATSEGKIRLELIGQLVWTDGKLERSGWRFLDIRSEQADLIEELTLLYASGQLASISDQRLAMTSDIKNLETGKDKEATAGKSGSAGIRRIIGLCFFAVLGVMAALYLGKVVYGKLFLMEASSASVFSPVTNITSPVEGTIGVLQAAGAVKEKQVIAKVVQPSGAVTEILSPCDCNVISVTNRNGSYVGPGELISVLVASDAKPTISVRLPFQDLARVVRGAKVDLVYLDGVSVKGAKIIGLPKIAEEESTIITLYVEPGRELTPAQVGEPVYAQINTAPW